MNIKGLGIVSALALEGVEFGAGLGAGRVEDKPVGSPLLVGDLLVAEFGDVARSEMMAMELGHLNLHVPSVGILGLRREGTVLGVVEFGLRAVVLEGSEDSETQELVEALSGGW